MKSIIINHETAGLPPGTPVYIGDRPASDMEISLIVYNDEKAEIKHKASISELKDFRLAQNEKTFCWLNIDGLGDIDRIKELASFFNIHSLTVEDI
jgi:magnesium transporter